MSKHNELAWSNHLVPSVIRTKVDWINRLGESQFNFCSHHLGLRSLEVHELNGIEGLFDFGDGLLLYKIELDGQDVLAIPVEGGPSHKNVNLVNQVFQARPEMLIKKIRNENSYSDLDIAIDLPLSVGFAQRLLDGKKFLLITCLNSVWLTNSANQALIKNAASKFVHTIVVSPTGKEHLEGLLNSDLSIVRQEVPNSDDQIKVSREIYGSKKLNLSTLVMLQIYNDKKIVIDLRNNGRTFLLGHELKIEHESHPSKYLKGVCKLAEEEELSSDTFAEVHMGCYQDNRSDVVRKARTQLTQAIKKSIKDPASLELALSLCAPECSKSKTVMSGFKKNDVQFLEG